MGSDWKEPDSAETVSEPTVEQFVYYFRLVEGDNVEWRATRQRAFQMDLQSLSAHLSKLCGRHVEWNLETLRQEIADPYLSQPLFNSGWVSWANGKRACHVEARTYGDAYYLHIRYHRRGSHPASLYQAMRHEDVWTPSQEEQILGQSLFLAGMVELESAHPLAAQILNLQNPPRQGIGELQTCSLGQARIYRGSLRPEISVVLYAQEGAEQAIGSLLERWAIRWELHRHKLAHELAWCDNIAFWLEEQAARLREALQNEQIQEEAKWENLLGEFQSRLETCLRRENAIQSDLTSLEWIANKLPTEGPDTYFAAALKPLRARRQQLAFLLVAAQRTRDEAVQAFCASSAGPGRPIHGDLSHLLLSSRQAMPVLEELTAARRLPPWSGRGWATAEAIYYPDDVQTAPNWSARRYERLMISLCGPRGRDGYLVRLSSSLGESQGDLRADELAPATVIADEAAASVSAQGERLFRALFGAAREETFRQTLALSRATGRGLALRLNIEQAPELEGLPWECLYDPEEEGFIAASAETPFARCSTGTGTERTTPSDLPLRLLAVVAAPKDCERFGLPAVNAEKELESVRAMLRPALEAKLLQVEGVAHASPSKVRQAILRFRPHIFHLVSHGASRRDLGHALLEDETGRGRLANARVLLEFLLNDEETRLVLLSPPEQATGRSLEPLVGLATQLHQSHSKAIMTLRQEMDARSRQRLWREFYRALLPWNAVDVALAEARRELLTEQGAADRQDPWRAPLLFLPGASGQMFYPKGSDKR